MKGSLFIIFVDLKRAFDKVIHEHLWTKLLKIGVSAKYIRILKDLYDKAFIRIKTPNGLTDKINMSATRRNP